MTLIKKLGKLPVKHDDRTLQVGKYLNAAALPTFPHVYQYSKDLGQNWGMMGNDSIGDCTCAAAGHGIMSWTDDCDNLVTPSDADIITAYSAVSGYDPATGANDNGAACLDVLNYWRKTGVGGRTINSYAQITVSNLHQLQASIYLFGLAYIGIGLPITAQNESKVWTLPHSLTGNGAPGSWGGHCVIVTGWDATGLDVITWGEQIRMTWGFWKAYVEEAYAIISNDFLKAGKSPVGFNLAQLQADLKLV